MRLVAQVYAWGLLSFVTIYSFSANASEIVKLRESQDIASHEDSLSGDEDSDLIKQPYSIQLASYMNERDAVAHVRQIKKSEPEVFYYPTFVRGQVWFKVCVGRFDDQKKAEEYRKVLVKKIDEPFGVVVSLLDKPQAPVERGVASTTGAKTDEKSLTNEGVTDIETAKKIETVRKLGVVKNPEPGGGVESNQTPTKKAQVEPTAEAAIKSTEVASVKATQSKLVESKDLALTAGASSEVFYSVQVGAFPSQELLDTDRRSLEEKGYQPFAEKVDVKGKTWFRLFIGRHPGYSLAERERKKLGHDLNRNDLFVKKMTNEKN